MALPRVISTAPVAFGARHGASGDGAPDPRTEHLGFLLVRATERVFGATRDALAPLGLTPRTYGALRVIAAHEPTSQITLAERIGVDRTTMGAMVDALEAAGVVQRTPHPADRRTYIVRVTEHGTVVLREGARVVTAVEQAVLRALDADARAALLGALRALAAGAP